MSFPNELHFSCPQRYQYVAPHAANVAALTQQLPYRSLKPIVECRYLEISYRSLPQGEGYTNLLLYTFVLLVASHRAGENHQQQSSQEHPTQTLHRKGRSAHSYPLNDYYKASQLTTLQGLLWSWSKQYVPPYLCEVTRLLTRARAFFVNTDCKNYATARYISAPGTQPKHE